MITIKYMGSKSRVAKYIVPIIQKCIDDNGLKTYIEPFVGGANIIDKVNCKICFGNDSNNYLIALFKHLQENGELLSEVPRELYNEVRSNYKNGEYEDWFVVNVGFLASYNGRWFDGGYAPAGYEITKNGKRYRDYYQEAKNNLEKQMLNCKDIYFTSGDYMNCHHLFTPKSMIYCDPPYQNAKQYANSVNFDYEEFWENMRKWSISHFVLISELNAPDDFVIVWEKPVSRSIKSTDKSTAVEKLFTYKNGKYYEYLNEGDNKQ